MKRRGFLQLMAALPGLGFLKSEAAPEIVPADKFAVTGKAWTKGDVVTLETEATELRLYRDGGLIRKIPAPPLRPIYKPKLPEWF